MTTNKTFKRGVRARMAKTGESYAAARSQRLRKAGTAAAATDADTLGTAEAALAASAEGGEPPAAATGGSTASADDTVELPTSDEAVRRATGRGYHEWFALLDAWGATERRRPEIARWLISEHGVSGWWSQSVTGGYERARGLRSKHQMAVGYAVSANKTLAVAADEALRAFTDDTIRGRWLPDAPLGRRPSRAKLAARFDWAEPPSRVAVFVEPAGDRRSRVSVQHERLPDAETADRIKRLWRERLAELKTTLESTTPQP